MEIDGLGIKTFLKNNQSSSKQINDLKPNDPGTPHWLFLNFLFFMQYAAPSVFYSFLIEYVPKLKFQTMLKSLWNWNTTFV